MKDINKIFEDFDCDDELSDDVIYKNFNDIYIFKNRKRGGYSFLIKYGDGWILPLNIEMIKVHYFGRVNKFTFNDYKVIDINDYKGISRTGIKGISRGKFKVNGLSIKGLHLDKKKIIYGKDRLG